MTRKTKAMTRTTPMCQPFNGELRNRLSVEKSKHKRKQIHTEIEIYRVCHKFRLTKQGDLF